VWQVQELKCDALFYDRLQGLVAAILVRGVCHNDLYKENNILVGPDGWPAVVDFQLASVHAPTSCGFRVRWDSLGWRDAFAAVGFEGGALVVACRKKILKILSTERLQKSLVEWLERSGLPSSPLLIRISDGFPPPIPWSFFRLIRFACTHESWGELHLCQGNADGCRQFGDQHSCRRKIRSWADAGNCIQELLYDCCRD
jgi:hypothetical protein